MFVKAGSFLKDVTDMQMLSKHGAFTLFSFMVQTIIASEPLNSRDACSLYILLMYHVFQ